MVTPAVVSGRLVVTTIVGVLLLPSSVAFNDPAFNNHEIAKRINYLSMHAPVAAVLFKSPECATYKSSVPVC